MFDHRPSRAPRAVPMELDNLAARTLAWTRGDVKSSLKKSIESQVPNPEPVIASEACALDAGSCLGGEAQGSW
jgi:hypothetical protein